jgi:ABC-type molybdate transport system substrate-binding protein
MVAQKREQFADWSPELHVDVDFLHGHYGPSFSAARRIAVLQPADLNILTRNCFSMVEV